LISSRPLQRWDNRLSHRISKVLHRRRLKILQPPFGSPLGFWQLYLALLGRSSGRSSREEKLQKQDLEATPVNGSLKINRPLRFQRIRSFTGSEFHRTWSFYFLSFRWIVHIITLNKCSQKLHLACLILFDLRCCWRILETDIDMRIMLS
jgi:hypothetical protein